MNKKIKDKTTAIKHGILILKDFFKSKNMRKNPHLIPIIITLLIFSLLGFLVISSGGISPLLYPLF